MEPVIVGPASPGNVGRDFNAIGDAVASRILSVVRERFPRAEISDSRPAAGPRVPPGYSRATAEPSVTPGELHAAGAALQNGATHLLVPTITEWREMRADDPIGALTVPHNSVTVTLRLMRLDPPALVGRVTFSNHARLTTNQRATHLLDEEFRQVVLRLVGATQ